MGGSPRDRLDSPARHPPAVAVDFDFEPRPSEPQTRAACLRCGRILNPTALGWVHMDLPFDEVHPAEPSEPWLYDYSDQDRPQSLRRESPAIERVRIEWWPLPVHPLEEP